jgi:hypothetical protein
LCQASKTPPAFLSPSFLSITTITTMSSSFSTPNWFKDRARQGRALFETARLAVTASFDPADGAADLSPQGMIARLPFRERNEEPANITYTQSLPEESVNQAWLRDLILASSTTELNTMLRTALDTHPLCDHTGLLTLYYLDRNCIDSSVESLWEIFTNLGQIRLTQFPGQAVPTAAHNIRVLIRWLQRCNFQQFDARIPVDNCMSDTTVDTFSYFYQSMLNQEELQQHRYTANIVLTKCEDFYRKALIKGTWLVTSPSSNVFSSVQEPSAQPPSVSSADTRRFAQVFAPPNGNQRHSKIIDGTKHHFCSTCGWNRRHLEAECPNGSSTQLTAVDLSSLPVKPKWSRLLVILLPAIVHLNGVVGIIAIVEDMEVLDAENPDVDVDVAATVQPVDNNVHQTQTRQLVCASLVSVETSDRCSFFF